MYIQYMPVGVWGPHDLPMFASQQLPVTLTTPGHMYPQEVGMLLASCLFNKTYSIPVEVVFYVHEFPLWSLKTFDQNFPVARLPSNMHTKETSITAEKVLDWP